MTQTPVTVTYPLEQVLTRIEQKIDKLDEKIDNLQIGQTKLEGNIKTLEVELKGEIKTLDTDIKGINKRIDFQEFINRGVIIGLIVALIGGAAKLFGWGGSP